MAIWTVICEAKTPNPPKSFGLTLDRDTDKWSVQGVGASRFFKTKKGKFDMHVLPTIGTTLVPESGLAVVAILDGLNGNSSVGDTGTGKQEETATDFKWRLDSK